MTYEDSEVCLYFLIHVLHLPVSLWVVGGRSQLNSKESCKPMGEVGYEGRSMVADHFLWKSMMVPVRAHPRLGACWTSRCLWSSNRSMKGHSRGMCPG